MDIYLPKASFYNVLILIGLMMDFSPFSLLLFIC